MGIYGWNLPWKLYFGKNARVVYQWRDREYRDRPGNTVSVGETLSVDTEQSRVGEDPSHRECPVRQMSEGVCHGYDSRLTQLSTSGTCVG